MIWFVNLLRHSNKEVRVLKHLQFNLLQFTMDLLQQKKLQDSIIPPVVTQQLVAINVFGLII